MATNWHLCLNRHGVVLAATDGAPPAWVGTRLDDLDDVPEELKDAGQAILGRARDAGTPMSRSVVLQSTGQAVHLVMVDAVPLQRVPTDLRALLRSTLEVMQRQAKVSDITLTVVVEGDVPAIVVLDAGKIAWAITVLVGNAFRYVHHGSRAMPGGSIAVRVTCNPAGSEVTMAVQDDGRGIPSDTLRCLFSAGPDQPRKGLALLMVHDVVEAHAGHIEVQSETDVFRHGTTIRLTVPVS